jgi:Na+-translocating ferredoxin:NAD+ oxidoreductase RnfC subunit
MQSYSFPSAQVWPVSQAVPDIWKSSESEQVDEASLYEVNHQIKCLLTDLLNCESVKSDKLYRAWVQARLMDAEHELKRQRRRRSSAAQETLRAINLTNCLSPDMGCRASF